MDERQASGSHYVVIVGCGRLGALLANRLSSCGHSVVVVDRDERAFASLSSEFGGFRVQGDAVEMEVLRSAHVDRADYFLATTDQDNVNLMLAQTVRVLFKVPTVIARVYDPAREEVYRELGVTTVSPTRLAADTLFGILGVDIRVMD